MSYNRLLQAVRDMPANPKSIHNYVRTWLVRGASFKMCTQLEYMIIKQVMSYSRPNSSGARTTTDPRGKEQVAGKPAKRKQRPPSSDSDSDSALGSWLGRYNSGLGWGFDKDQYDPWAGRTPIDKAVSSESDSDSSSDNSGRYISGLGWGFETQDEDFYNPWAGWEVIKKKPQSDKPKTNPNKRQRRFSASASSSPNEDLILAELVDKESKKSGNGPVAVGKLLRRGVRPVSPNKPGVAPVQTRLERFQQQPIVISSSSSSSSSSDSDGEDVKETNSYTFDMNRLRNAIEPVLLPEYIEPMNRRLEDLEKYEFIQLEVVPTELPKRITRAVQRHLDFLNR